MKKFSAVVLVVMAFLFVGFVVVWMIDEAYKMVFVPNYAQNEWAKEREEAGKEVKTNDVSTLSAEIVTNETANIMRAAKCIWFYGDVDPRVCTGKYFDMFCTPCATTWWYDVTVGNSYTNDLPTKMKIVVRDRGTKRVISEREEECVLGTNTELHVEIFSVNDQKQGKGKE